jgi:predicted Na+-dependent transporter
MMMTLARRRLVFRADFLCVGTRMMVMTFAVLMLGKGWTMLRKRGMMGGDYWLLAAMMMMVVD